MEAPSAVILAGGLGTRIRHLLADRPKPLASVAGKPFLEWLLLFLAKQGIERVTVSAGYRAEMIAEFCAALAMPRMRVSCVAEKTPQGTAGGFMEAVAGERNESWLVCNGDSLACADLTGFIKDFDTSDDAALVALRLAEGRRYGNLTCGAASQLTGFAEKTAQTGLINAGIYLLRRRVLKHFPAKRPLSFETDVFPALLKAGAKIRVHKISAPFIDIGTEDSLRQAENFIQANKHSFL